jgi:hypothetical protein
MSNCSICLDTCEQNTFKLECSHSFCNKCITRWLLMNNSCPSCRANIIENNAISETNPEIKIIVGVENNIHIIPIIYYSILDRIDDIINIVYFQQIAQYSWKVLENNYYITKINIKKRSYTIELNMNNIDNTIYILVTDLIINKKYSKFENDNKNNTQKWRFKPNGKYYRNRNV